MIQEIDKNMETLIRGWGLPEALKEQEGNIGFQFYGHRIVNNHEQEYFCNDGDVKFCLYNKRNNKALFSMSFYKPAAWYVGLKGTDDKPITLKLLYVIDDLLRDKKIATFYVRKLQEYAYDEGMNCIYVTPNTDVDIFKNNMANALSQSELERYYNKLSTTEIPIRLIL